MQVGGNAEKAIKEITAERQQQRGRGIYPVKNALDLMMSSMNVMMDANLMLQVCACVVTPKPTSEWKTDDPLQQPSTQSINGPLA